MYNRQLGTHGLPYERTNIMWTDILRIFSKLSEVLPVRYRMDCLSVWLAGIMLVKSCRVLSSWSCVVFLILPCLALSCLTLSYPPLHYPAFSISICSYCPLTSLLHRLLLHLFHRTLNVTYTRPKEKQCFIDLKKRNGQVNMMRTTMTIWRLLIVTKAVRRPYVPWSPTLCPNAPL